MESNSARAMGHSSDDAAIGRLGPGLAWPCLTCCNESGGGIKPGIVVGATNKKGEHPVDRALWPPDVLATVYRQLGIDTRLQFVNTAGRPISILAGGEPISELL